MSAIIFGFKTAAGILAFVTCLWLIVEKSAWVAWVLMLAFMIGLIGAFFCACFGPGWLSIGLTVFAAWMLSVVVAVKYPSLVRAPEENQSSSWWLR